MDLSFFLRGQDSMAPILLTIFYGLGLGGMIWSLYDYIFEFVKN